MLHSAELPEDAVVIGSQAKLVLSAFEGPDVEGWHSYLATLSDAGLSASVRVCDLGLAEPPHHLLGLFESMSRDWKGWEGEKVWGSLEGQLELHGTSDRTGHAYVRVRIANSAWPEGWEASATLELDVMQRERAVGELRRFFSTA